MEFLTNPNSIKEHLKTTMKICSESCGKAWYMCERRLISLLICLVFAALFLMPAQAADSTEKVVRVGWYESSFNRTDDAGRRTGYAYEYQMKIAGFTGWKYEYVRASWSELLQMLKDGTIDLMSDVSYTAERAEQMLFPSLPMGSEEYYLFVDVKNREITSTTPSSLNGKKIGVNKGSIQAEYFREWAQTHNVQAELVELTNTEEESISMLKTGKLDAYVTVDSFAQDVVSDPQRPQPVFKIGSSDYYFAVSINRPDLLDELENAMNRIQQENPYYNQQLAETHLVSTGTNAFLAADELEWLEAHGPIRVGYQDNYLAFCAADPETGELTGALKDYLEQAAGCILNAQIVFESKAYPTAEDMIEAMGRGEVDCTFPANLSSYDGEEKHLFMTSALMRTDVFAVVRQKDRQIFTGREHVIVAVNKGNPNYESFLLDHYPDWRTVYYPTTLDCLQAVSRGVADCILISSYRYNNIARDCER